MEYSRPPLTQYQLDAFFHTARYGIVEGSTKSGKTYPMMAWLFEQAAVVARHRNYWWVAPVYPQAKIAYARLKRAIPEPLRRANDTELTLTLANDRILWFKSGEKPDNLYGDDVGAAGIDEGSRFRAEAWHAVRSTLTATQGPIRIVGNIKGTKNWFYLLARQAEEGAPNMRWAKFISADAVRAGILSAAEVEDAQRVLPKAVFEELYLGIPSPDGGNPFGLQHIEACVAPQSKAPAVVFGVDLAKSVDWTVVIGLDWAGRVAELHRWQAPWRETKQQIRDIVKGRFTLVDSTGVGDPVLEDLQRGEGTVKDRAGNFEGFKFTSASKQQLMEGLAAGIQQGKVTFPDGPVRIELESFEYEYTRTGVLYGAPEGMHDDCVVALALAYSVWSGTAGQRPTSVWSAGQGANAPTVPSWKR